MTGCRPRLLAASETPLDGDDTLGQILLRLPPRPSSLLRAAAVCKRWRRVVSDPHFRRSFCVRHQKAPLLGYFALNNMSGSICFVPALDPPDCVASERFSLPISKRSKISGCRHGRVLVINRNRNFLVWDPVTGAQQRVYYPMEFRGQKFVFNGAVICASRDPGHVHGSCHSSPFQVVLLGHTTDEMLACVYSSETDSWGNATSMPLLQWNLAISTKCPKNFLVGNSIYWLLTGENLGILQFDLGRQSLALIEGPEPQNAYSNAIERGDLQVVITAAEGAGLGFLVVSGFNTWLWKKEVDSEGSVEWVLTNTIDLGRHVPRPHETRCPIEMLGLAEDENVMFLLVHGDGIYMVNRESLQFKKLCVPYMTVHLDSCYPFTSFYPSGTGIGGEHDEV